MIELYPHQAEAISDLGNAFREIEVNSALLQSPTGSGKTIMALFIIMSSVKRGQSTFFICHRRELLDQTAGTFKKNGLKFGIIAAGYKPDYSKKIQICSIDTLKNRLHLVTPPRWIIWDECQHIAAAGWRKVQDHFSGAYHIGLSATPSRLSGEGLDNHFDVLVPGKPVRWLIDNKFLAEYRLFSVPGIDLSGAHTRMGEYVTADAEAAIDKPSIMGDVVKHWQKYASDRLTIGFAPSIKMSKKLCEAFNLAGIPSVHLDGKTPKSERRELLQKFARGEFMVAWNVGLFGEGYDIAANSGIDVTIGCVIDCAPTQAIGMWLQRCGRGLRKQDRPAILLDHAGNAGRHGLPCQEREWSLTSVKRSKKDKIEPDVLAKQCESCYCVHKPAKICPECGYVYPIMERKIDEKEGELVEVTAEMLQKKEDRMQQGMANDIESLMALGKSRKAATHIIQARNDKRCLQEEVFSLCGLYKKLPRYAINNMKPKPMKLLIEECKRACFNSHVVLNMIDKIG